MEIKSVENEIKNEYPKLKQVGNKHLSNSIPRKWIKVGLSSLIISIIAKKHAFAMVEISDMDIQISGDYPVHITTPVDICNEVCPIVRIVSAAVFLITSIIILINKEKSEKQSKPIKVKKWIKVLFVISIIVFILSIITQIILNNIYN